MDGSGARERERDIVVTGAGVLRHMGDDLPTLEVMLPCETGRGRLRAWGDAPPRRITGIRSTSPNAVYPPMRPRSVATLSRTSCTLASDASTSSSSSRQAFGFI